MESLNLATDNPQVVLRQLTVEHASAYFEAVEANRTHLSQFGDKTAANYPTLQSVIDSIITPANSDRLRMGVWDNDTFVGTVNLTPDEDGKAAEVGYWTDSRYLRRGYATLAARALSHYGLEHYETVYAHVSTEETEDGERVNQKSVEVLKKAGFIQTAKEIGRLTFTLNESTLLPSARELTLTQADQETLLPGDTIIGLTNDRDFNSLEILLARKVHSGYRTENSILTRRPLATQLRPKRFLGDWRNGHATILPADKGTIEALKKRHGAAALYDLTRVMVYADMYSTGQGIQGSIAREISYHMRNGSLEGTTYGEVVRTLGPGDLIKLAEQQAKLLNTSSAQRSRQARVYALRHPFSGGIPT